MKTNGKKKLNFIMLFDGNVKELFFMAYKSLIKTYGSNGFDLFVGSDAETIHELKDMQVNATFESVEDELERIPDSGVFGTITKSTYLRFYIKEIFIDKYKLDSFIYIDNDVLAKEKLDLKYIYTRENIACSSADDANANGWYKFWTHHLNKRITPHIEKWNKSIRGLKASLIQKMLDYNYFNAGVMIINDLDKYFELCEKIKENKNLFKFLDDQTLLNYYNENHIRVVRDKRINFKIQNDRDFNDDVIFAHFTGPRKGIMRRIYDNGNFDWHVYKSSDINFANLTLVFDVIKSASDWAIKKKYDFYKKYKNEIDIKWIFRKKHRISNKLKEYEKVFILDYDEFNKFKNFAIDHIKTDFVYIDKIKGAPTFICIDNLRLFRHIGHQNTINYFGRKGNNQNILTGKGIEGNVVFPDFRKITIPTSIFKRDDTEKGKFIADVLYEGLVKGEIFIFRWTENLKVDFVREREREREREVHYYIMKKITKKGVLIYNFKETEIEQMNIGDYIQSLAALNIVDEDWRNLIKINREMLYETPKGLKENEIVKIIANAWYVHNKYSFPGNKKINPLFISMHAHSSWDITKKTVKYLKKFEPIGCRDQHTTDLFNELGIKAYFSGCLTLTFNEYKGSREGIVFIVDNINDITSYEEFRSWMGSKFVMEELLKTYSLKEIEEAKFITQQAIHKNDEAKNFKLAEKYINTLKSAKLVVTTRIHSLMPSMSLGTPALLIMKNNKDWRFSGLEKFWNYIDFTKFDSGNGVIKSIRRDKKGNIINSNEFREFMEPTVKKVKDFWND